MGYYQPGYRTRRQGCSQDLFLGLLSRHAWSLAKIEWSRSESNGADTARPADDIGRTEKRAVPELLQRLFESLTSMSVSISAFDI